MDLTTKILSMIQLCKKEVNPNFERIYNVRGEF